MREGIKLTNLSPVQIAHQLTMIAVELKICRFKPEYAGKMNFYLNLLDDFVREPGENPSIGIILYCVLNVIILKSSTRYVVWKSL